MKCSRKSVKRIFEEVNAACYSGHGPDYRFGSERIIVNPLQAYERLLLRLGEASHIQFVTFGQLFSASRPQDKIQIVIRHDVDGDIVTALRQAEIEHMLRIVSTYFILHTAPYYGSFENGVFHRHERLKGVYSQIQELGHEVALHNDSLHVFQNWDVDGSEALVKELEWMRANGLDVHGTVSHNSLGVYGAENYEIFKGRPLVEWKPDQPGDYKEEDEVCFRGKRTPLRVLDESELGLRYEGIDAFRYGDGPIEYGATRFLNRWRWNMQIKRWKNRPAPPNTWFADEDTVIGDILGLPCGTLVILTIHPVYYGCRHSPTESPSLRRNQLEFSINDRVGWEAYKSETIQCFFKDGDADPRQAINFSNEMGMLDKPWPPATNEANLRILLLGSDNLDARHVGIDAQCQVLLEAFLREALQKTIFVRKLAFPGMGISRLWPWYEAARQLFQPDIVCIGIGGDELHQNLTLPRSSTTGPSTPGLSGAYLVWDAERKQVRQVSASTVLGSHPAETQEHDLWPEAGCDTVEALLNEGRHTLEWIGSLYEYVIKHLREEGICPLLLLENLGTLSTNPMWRTVVGSSEWGHNVRRIIAKLADDLQVVLVDPYEAFEREPGAWPGSHTDGRWTYTGHRLVAEALFEQLNQIPSSQELSTHID